MKNRVNPVSYIFSKRCALSPSLWALLLWISRGDKAMTIKEGPGAHDGETSASFMNYTPMSDEQEKKRGPCLKRIQGKSQAVGVCTTLWTMTHLDVFCIQHISQERTKCLLSMLLLLFPVIWLFETGKERGRSVDIQLNLQLIWRWSANTINHMLPFHCIMPLAETSMGNIMTSVKT